MKHPSKNNFCYAAFAVLLTCLLPAHAVSATRGTSVDVVNNIGADQVIYFMTPDVVPPTTVITAFKALRYPCLYPTDVYSGQGNQYTCHFTLPQGATQTMPLTDFATGKLRLAISAGNYHYPQGPCNTTFAEFTLNDAGTDSYDISLVNGRSFNLDINPTGNGQAISLKAADDPKTTLGVYPVGCSKCVDNVGTAPAFAKGYGDAANCPGFGRASGPMPAGSCKTGPEMNPSPNKCGIDAVPTGGVYTVRFNAM